MKKLIIGFIVGFIVGSASTMVLKKDPIKRALIAECEQSIPRNQSCEIHMEARVKK